MSWAITAIFSLLLVNIPVSVGMWYAGDAARVLFQQVCMYTPMTSSVLVLMHTSACWCWRRAITACCKHMLVVCNGNFTLLKHAGLCVRCASW